MNTMPELLLPAGDMEKLRFALAYGADAVYAGVPMFSLRARENGFTWDSLKEAVQICRDQKKKIYFTANIYAHNQKIKPFIESFKKMEELKPDAYIMSDPGLIDIVRTEFPSAEIHLSVQANNVNWAQVKFWEKLGIKRIILSRELSLREIREIREQCPNIELEVFVHGAICVAYSGRCLLSNYFTYRDANQGTCTHSCRWKYRVYHDKDSTVDLREKTGRPEDYHHLSGRYYIEEKERPGQMMPIDEDEFGTYVMNSRDLCLIGYLRELRDAGVNCFKVEGRSKTVNYLAGVGKAYRTAIDAMGRNEDYDVNALLEELFSVSNRGYTSGFLLGDPGSASISYGDGIYQRTQDFIAIVREYDAARSLARVEVKFRFDIGQELLLVSPKLNNSFVVSTILNPNDESLTAAHGGSFDVWINVPCDPGEYAIIRRPVSSQPLDKTA
jgi:putative protease